MDDVGDRVGHATTLNNIGGVYYELGHLDKALKFFNQALSIMPEVGDRDVMAITLRDIGDVYVALGQTDNAVEYYDQTLPIFDELDNIDDEVVIRTRISFILFEHGNLKEAETHLLRVVALWEAGQSPSLELDRETLAAVQRRMSDQP